ncbi:MULTISPECIES: hypothetical protein [unclassified Microbacterium]|uniref:hypothetical protein n=1 Tax=unclassified Microbacterium TaxID=2609290 RepID=UPI0034201C87
MTAQTPAPDASMRTPERPMAFSTDELLNGGLLTWLLFCGLVPVGILASMLWALPSATQPLWSDWLISGLAILVISVIVAIVSLVLVPFGILLVRPIALALRRVRAMPVHVTAYTVLGAAIGALYLTVIGTIPSLTEVNTYTILITTPAVAITIATPLGWWLSARRALRKDAGLVRTRADEDAVVEDATTP